MDCVMAGLQPIMPAAYGCDGHLCEEMYHTTRSRHSMVGTPQYQPSVTLHRVSFNTENLDYLLTVKVPALEGSNCSTT